MRLLVLLVVAGSAVGLGPMGKDQEMGFDLNRLNAAAYGFLENYIRNTPSAPPFPLPSSSSGRGWDGRGWAWVRADGGAARTGRLKALLESRTGQVGEAERNCFFSPIQCALSSPALR